MTAPDPRMRIARVALFFFGAPCAASVTGLQLEPSLTQILPLRVEIIESIAVASGIGLLLTTLLTWMADRWVVRRQERKLVELTKELTLVQREFDSEEKRWAMELKLSKQELEMEHARLKSSPEDPQLERYINTSVLNVETADATTLK